MADPNLKAPPPVTERFVTIQQSQRHQRYWRSGYTPPLYPWMRLAGRRIEHAGFEAGERVKITVEHRRLTITTD